MTEKDGRRSRTRARGVSRVQPSTGAGSRPWWARTPNWMPRAMVWSAFLAAALVAAVLMTVTALHTMLGTAGHFAGLLALAVIAAGALLVIVIYGFDAWTQAREINRAIDRIDNALAADPERDISDAEGRVYQAGGTQTAGLFVMIGLIVFALMFHAAYMVTPQAQKPPAQEQPAAAGQ